LDRRTQLEQVTLLVRREEPGRSAWSESTLRGREVIASEVLPGFAGMIVELWTDAEMDENGAEVTK
jgi:hypothetical protein